MPQGAIPVTSATNQLNQGAPGKLGFQSEQWIGARHGRNHAASLTGNVGMAANSAGVTTSAALATTYVGICLSNPAGSGKNLAVLTIAGGLIVAPSTITGINLIAGYSAAGVVTHTTALTVLNALVGTSAAALVGKVDSACTIVGTPAFVMPLAQSPTAIISPFFSNDLGGSLIIPPGGYVAIGTTIAGPSSGFMGSFLWEEITL